MKCPSCGLENDDDETYCDDCGALLTSTPLVLEQRSRHDLLEVGQELHGKYRIEARDVSGVFNVYRASRNDDGRPCRILEDAEAAALEAVTSDASEPAAEDRSRATLVWRALGGISNPHLWEVDDFFYENGRAFVVGAPLPAWNLQTYLQDAEPLEWEEIRALGLALLEALSIIHQRQFLHLGLYPRSIYIDDGGLAVLDGYERLTPMGSEATVHSVIEGYSSPEAYGIGGEPTAVSDIYGVGVTLYFVVTRSVPAAVSREQFFFFPPLSTRVKNVPPALEAVIMKALSKDARARFQSAYEMHEALESLDLDRSAFAAEASPESARYQESVKAGEGGAQPLLPAAVPTHSPGTRAQPLQGGGTATLVRPERAGFCPYKVGMKSHVGCVRSVNQDSFLVMALAACERSTGLDVLLAVVADGMGGEAEGDKASSLAIRALAAHILRDRIPVVITSETMKLRSEDPVERMQELLREAMEDSNRVIFEYSEKDSARRGMGSTLTALMIDWPHAVFGHAGDTRAYVLRGSDIDQVTEDHSLVGKLVRLGQLSREDARTSPQRSYLYRAMGTQNELEMDTYSRLLEPGDRLLLCCDGVWEYFSDAELIDFLSSGDDPQETCDRLIDETLRRGADDNCTAIVVHVPLALR